MSRTLIYMCLTLLVGCAQEPFKAPRVLGGETISAEVLNRGHELYVRYCQTCHGEQGDGKGPSSWGQWPSPRDFRSAKFKFAGVLDRGLPSDDELVRIIRGGLAGTAMKAWDLPEPQMRAVIQYLKTFSPEGKGFRNPDLEVQVPQIPDDPFASNPTEGARVGERLYHSVFQCAQCHPQYAPDASYQAWNAPAPRPIDPRESVPKAAPSYDNVLLPPDFRRHPMRSIRREEQGFRVDDLYRVIAYGLQGPMPAYEHLGTREVWAVAHYVKSIADRSN